VNERIRGKHIMSDALIKGTLAVTALAFIIALAILWHATSQSFELREMSQCLEIRRTLGEKHLKALDCPTSKEIDAFNERAMRGRI
jgi:hypothetical protein